MFGVTKKQSICIVGDDHDLSENRLYRKQAIDFASQVHAPLMLLLEQYSYGYKNYDVYGIENLFLGQFAALLAYSANTIDYMNHKRCCEAVGKTYDNNLLIKFIHTIFCFVSHAFSNSPSSDEILLRAILNSALSKNKDIDSFFNSFKENIFNKYRRKIVEGAYYEINVTSIGGCISFFENKYVMWHQFIHLILTEFINHIKEIYANDVTITNLLNKPINGKTPAELIDVIFQTAKRFKSTQNIEEIRHYQIQMRPVLSTQITEICGSIRNTKFVENIKQLLTYKTPNKPVYIIVGDQHIEPLKSILPSGELIINGSKYTVEYYRCNAQPLLPAFAPIPPGYAPII